MRLAFRLGRFYSEMVNPIMSEPMRHCSVRFSFFAKGLATLLLFLCPRAGFAEAVSFQNDIMAVLSKAGCNAGTCHGNKNGKGGFKLSLRGQDPDADYATLTHDIFSRRLDSLDADHSLILLKPTTVVAHEGGQRFKKDSPEYEMLRRWITAGMPNDSLTAPKLENIT